MRNRTWLSLAGKNSGHCGPPTRRRKCCSVKKSITFARCRDGGRKRERRWRIPELLPNCTKGWVEMTTPLLLNFGREIFRLGVCAFGGGGRIFLGIVALQGTCACSLLLYSFPPTNSLLLVGGGIEKWSTHESLGGPKITSSCSKDCAMVVTPTHIYSKQCV
jgi:hypothetical protein